jgi:magnesium transporter
MSDKHEHISEESIEYDSIDGIQSTTTMVDQEFLEDIVDLIETQSSAALVNIIADLHSADIAEIINHIPVDKSKYLFSLLQAEEASEVILELQESVREDLVEFLTPERLTDIVEELESDDAVDIVAELDEDVAQEVLDHLPAEESAELLELLSYDEESAGGIMGTEFPVVNIHAVVQDATDSVREVAEDTPDVYEVFVVDDENRLRGIVDLKSLLLNGPSRKIEEIMDPEVISVSTMVDQEDVAHVMRKYDLITIPVVNESNQPVGVITFDDIADVLHEEAIEDIERMSGIIEHQEGKTSILGISRSRVPWLLVGFGGELLAAIVISSFGGLMREVWAAALFIPVIMAMGGNCGIQSSSVVVRGLATGEFAFTKTFVRLSKEFFSALISGGILAALLFVIVYFWIGNLNFGIVVSLSLLVVMTNATLVGSTVPLILDRFGIDPAIATGPFITTVNDALGLFIYLMFLTLIYI